MKSLEKVATAAFLALLAFGPGTFAVPPPHAGGGNSAGTPTPPDYGDLWILYRDANGVPYVTPGEENYGLCQQPLPAADCPADCMVDGVPTGVAVVTVDPTTCAVPPECAACTQEVEFERDNVVRADPSVLEAQLEDATIKLATAGCVTLDPAGRPVASTLVDDAVVSSAVDSPLQNLGFYRKLMRDGYLGVDADHIDLLADNWLDSAARALGASYPKEGQGRVDTVVYINEILGLTESDASSLLCRPCLTQTVRQEVMGEMRRVTKRYLDYSGYAYDRETSFSALPSPAYIGMQESYEYPASGAAQEGYFEFMEVVYDGTVLATYYTTDSIFARVFGSEDNLDSAALNGFSRAADDTRAVISFVHAGPVPDAYATPVPCDAAAPADLFDVFISPQSGLKVPVQMAAAGDGREGSVTVENAGPMTAVNVAVMVEGRYRDADGQVQTVPLRVSLLDTTPIFDAGAEPLDPIEPGYSASITFFFEMAEAAEIEWTARAYPTDDANPANNEVSGTTVVRKPKGGGGGGH